MVIFLLDCCLKKYLSEFTKWRNLYEKSVGDFFCDLGFILVDDNDDIL